MKKCVYSASKKPVAGEGGESKIQVLNALFNASLYSSYILHHTWYSFLRSGLFRSGIDNWLFLFEARDKIVTDSQVLRAT